MSWGQVQGMRRGEAADLSFVEFTMIFENVTPAMNAGAEGPEDLGGERLAARFHVEGQSSVRYDKSIGIRPTLKCS